MTIKLKKILFIDRDGVINKNAAEHEYITQVKDFHFNPGIFKLLKSYQDKNFEIIVITNQRGVARKMLSFKKLTDIHEYMKMRLARCGIKIFDIFVCPHQNNACNCRKPKPGLLMRACKRYKIDLSKSILISDSYKDVLMGKNFGIKRSYLVKRDKPCLFI